jgi:hypothetical protein
MKTFTKLLDAMLTKQSTPTWTGSRPIVTAGQAPTRYHGWDPADVSGYHGWDPADVTGYHGWDPR